MTQICWIVVKIGAFQMLTRHAFCPLYPANNTVEAFLSLPLWQQNYISAMQIFLGSLNLDSTYRVFTIFAVGMGLSAPEYNAPFFGSLADAYSVRQFWGRYWHQTFRKVSFTTQRTTFDSQSSFHLRRAPRYSTLQARWLLGWSAPRKGLLFPDTSRRTQATSPPA